MADASVRLGLDPSGPLAGWERRVVALPAGTWAAIDEIAGHYADLPGPLDQAAALAAGVGAEWVLGLYSGDSDRIRPRWRRRSTRRRYRSTRRRPCGGIFPLADAFVRLGLDPSGVVAGAQAASAGLDPVRPASPGHACRPPAGVRGG